MQSLVIQAVGLFIYCVVLAWLEIEIEGAHGWAANLPTWRRQPRWASETSVFFRLLRAVLKLMSGGNELTGYHLAMISFVFLSLMLPVLMVPSLLLFIRCLGFFLLTCVTWDFLWFVMNPAFGVKRFNRREIKWHPKWIGPVPSAYPFGYLIGGALVAFSLGQVSALEYVVIPALLLVLTVLCIVVVEAR